jgi:NADH/F420H2 dehydrogenase subunit C
MNNETLKEFILQTVPDAQFEEGKQYLLVTIPAEKIHPLSEKLKSVPSASYDYLFCLTGADWQDHMQVIYHLQSTEHNHSFVLKARIEGREKPEIETVCYLWPTAEFHEREAYDLFGIVFKNHPDLRRIFLDEDWVGYPMRKDYDDPINMIEY